MRNVTSPTRIVRGAAVVALLLAGACNIPFRHSDRHPYPKKAVTAKEGISVLVAGESRCFVSTKEFAKARVGEQYECNWREGGPAVPPAK